ncbi:unnamed protein product [Rotaria sp. Silwood2]|nr:unnamed protein product [Rotaria sp. Silwood2]CAF4109376.1 unnamed protein product [Rotaria sp. Silwood2]
MTKYQIKLGQNIIAEWCWNTSRQQIFEQWMDSSITINKLKTTSLTAIYYNIRYFLLNQLELLQMIKEYQSMIISLNKLRSHTDMKSIEQVLLGYEIIKAEDTNKHGGAILTIDKRIRYVLINLHKPNIAAETISLNDSTYTITSIYSPSNTPLPLETMLLLLTYSNYTILLGDFNAKHIDWGCSTINSKGDQLSKSINDNNLTVHNTNIRTSLRSTAIINLVITNQ